MRKHISAVLLFLCSAIYAGDFSVTANLNPVSVSGYYKILLSPEILSYSNGVYSDIRLFNSKGAEMPYIFNEETPAAAITGFKEYQLLENRHIPGKKLTRVVISNAPQKVISSLSLVVRNTEVEKEITLKGSDDQQNWYIIQKSTFDKGEKFNETSSLFTIIFPPSDYGYFEISVNDKKKDPVQILKVGYYDSKTAQGLYSPVPIRNIAKTDSSNKKSYLTISLPGEYEFSKIEFEISEPELFRRNCYLAKYKTYNNKKVLEIIQNFELSSEKQNILETDKLRTRELIIVIENNDNVPLKINNIRLYQLSKFLIAKLDKGENYSLKTGNRELPYPEYDIKYFRENIPEELTVIKTRNLKIANAEVLSESQTIFTKTILWIVILIVIAILGFFSVKTVKEMKNKE